jgi:hypothetical protein
VRRFSLELQEQRRRNNEAQCIPGKSPDEILIFLESVYLFQWRHFTFKKAGLVDSESFRLYFQAIFEDTDWN